MTPEPVCLLVYWARPDPALPMSAQRVDVFARETPGDRGLSACPGPDAPEVMFRHTAADEVKGLDVGFKLYGVGRWEATSLGRLALAAGPAEGFLVTPAQAADVLNGLFRMGWRLDECPRELADVHERAWNPNEPDDLRPLSAAAVASACAKGAP